MIKAMVFDVDDTLYDLSVPFRRTAEEVFPGKNWIYTALFWPAGNMAIRFMPSPSGERCP